ncbi:hypothetical protein BASA60_005351 [Batrachochytrium salamandrivorans]|nr:hypothetical protein BASA60_005351 [Batrachochytrium salamandrivorans]
MSYHRILVPDWLKTSAEKANQWLSDIDFSNVALPDLGSLLYDGLADPTTHSGVHHASVARAIYGQQQQLEQFKDLLGLTSS